MEVLQAIKTRRSYRKYKSEQITDEDLIKVLESGTYAPTGHGTQEPWIVAVQNKEQLPKLRKLNFSFYGQDLLKSLDNNREYDPYYGCPTIIFVFAEKDNVNGIKDGTLVLGNMMLAAHALGLATCWINRADKMFESIEGQQFLQNWGLPNNVIGVGALSIGYKDCPEKEAKPRKEQYFRIIK